MTDLYICPSVDPQPLPFEAYDPDKRLWTDLADNEEGREATGWDRIAPAKHADTASKVAVWDGEAEEWVMADRPTVPGEPPVIVRFPPISDRQFFQALATPPYSIITQQEALDAMKTGEIPAVMQAVIDMLPEEEQFPATALIAGGTTYERDNPLVEVFGSSQNMTAAEIDAFWEFAGGL